MCERDGCDRPVNRDGLCLPHKLKTASFNVGSLKRERNGADASGGRGTREYVRDMYEKRRAAGLPDPIPENSKSAAFAPRRKITEGGVI
jgi:hypothetical protein